MYTVHLDTEFNRKDFTKRGLVSIGLVTEYASYYAVNNDMDLQGIVTDPEIGEWMTANVFEPHILTHSLRRIRQDNPDVKDYATIAREVDYFLKAACPVGTAQEEMELIVNCGSQDVVRLHTLLANNDWSLFGDHVPQFADDMARVKRKAYRRGLKKADLPVQRPETVHHALYDAEYEMEVLQFIRERFGDL